MLPSFGAWPEGSQPRDPPRGRISCRGSVLQVHSEILANFMLHLMPTDAFKAARVCRSWHAAVILSGRLRTVMTVGSKDCPWSAAALSRLFDAFPHLQELHMTTEQLLPIDAISTIARHFSSTLRCLSAFVVSNCVQGQQLAVTEIARITSLESLFLEGTLLTGYSLVELSRTCRRLRKLYCHEILASHAEVQVLLDRCPDLEMLWGLNLSVHNEIDGVQQEPVSSLLPSISRVRSLGLNLFEERDPSIIKSIADMAGHNLVSLRMRACSFTARSLLYSLPRCSRLESLSIVAWNDDAAGGGSACRLRTLDSVFSLLPYCALPALNSLELDEFSVSNKGLAALACHTVAPQLTSLECLDLKEASSTTYICLLRALSSLRRLRFGVAPDTTWLAPPAMMGKQSCADSYAHVDRAQSAAEGDARSRGGEHASSTDDALDVKGAKGGAGSGAGSRVVVHERLGRHACHFIRRHEASAGVGVGVSPEWRRGMADAALGNASGGGSSAGRGFGWENRESGSTSDLRAPGLLRHDSCPAPHSLFHEGGDACFSPSVSSPSDACSPPTPPLSNVTNASTPASPSSIGDSSPSPCSELALVGGWQAEGDEVPALQVAWTWPAASAEEAGADKQPLEKLEALSICWHRRTRLGHETDGSAGAGGGDDEADDEAERAVLIAGLGRLPKLASLELSDWPVLLRSDLEALASSAASLSRFTLSLPQRVSLDSLRGLAHKNSRLGMLRVITFAQSLQHDFDTGVGPAAGDEPHMRASASAETDLRDPAHAIPTRNLPRLGPQQDLGVSSGVDQSGGVEVPGDGAAGVDGLEALKRAFSRQLPRCHCWFDVMQ